MTSQWMAHRLRIIEQQTDKLNSVRQSFAASWPGNAPHGWHEDQIALLWASIEAIAKDPEIVGVVLEATE